MLDRERLADLEARTPADRDRYVDFLRAFSITTVVFGHFFIALIHWEDGRIFVHNAVGHQSGLWLATWVLQVMPIFFFVGGFSNSVGWGSVRRSGGTYSEFVRRRVTRLLKPTLVFATAWAGVEVVLHLADIGAPGLLRGTFLPFGPMWFLGVYMLVVALAPLMLSLHERFRLAVPLAIAIAVAVIDLARFAFDVTGVGWANLALVWLFVHQIGFFYADGSLVAAGVRAWRILIAGGLMGLVVLTNLEVVTGVLNYPRSMVGVDIEPVSNMSPPSLAIVMLAIWQIGAAMALRDRANRWLQRSRPWQLTIAANSMIMTVFLWHLTAFLIVIVVLYPLGLGQDVTASARWWIERPLWLLTPLLPLALLIGVFSRYER